MADQPEVNDSIVVETPVDQPAEVVLSGKDDIKVEPTERVAQAPVSAVPEYAPNYSYKVYDEELEMPDWAKALVKDKDLEENFRSIFSKSGGFDPLKKKYEGAKTERDDLSQRFNKTVDRIGELQHYLDNDLHTFFKEANVPQDKIIAYVKTLIREGEMLPEEKTRLEQNREYVAKTWKSNHNETLLKEQNDRLMRNQHEIDYSNTLTDPEVASFKSSYEEKLGKGSFRKKADEYGDYMYTKTGRNISPREACQYVIENYRPFFDGGSNAAPAPVKSGIVEARKERDSHKPTGTIPNVGRGAASVSPTKARFTSLDQLKKHVKEMEG